MLGLRNTEKKLRGSQIFPAVNMMTYIGRYIIYVSYINIQLIKKISPPLKALNLREEGLIKRMRI